MKLYIENGTRFGRLVVLGEGKTLRLPSGQINRTLNCLCDCVNTKDVRVASLTRGHTESCGCICAKWKGLSQTLIYGVWRTMQARCNGEILNSPKYLEKGIKVCQEWITDYLSFYDWAMNNGYKKGLTLDRIDNDKGYCPENCRWTTQEINNNNRGVTFMVIYKNTKEPLKLLLNRLNKPEMYQSVMDRINRGWNHDKAIDTPLRKGNYQRGKDHYTKRN
jgi:hypothetical protein